jgi:hypothetical protein
MNANGGVNAMLEMKKNTKIKIATMMASVPRSAQFLASSTRRQP